MNDNHKLGEHTVDIHDDFKVYLDEEVNVEIEAKRTILDQD